MGEAAETLLLAVALGAARTVPLAWLIPALGGPRVTSEVRVGLGLVLAVLSVPALAPAVASGAASSLGNAFGLVGWALLLGREVLVGLTVGLAAGTLFRAAEAAGRLVDVLRGANLAEVFSPLSEERSSPMGDLYLFVAVVVFLELGGLRTVAVALARSYEAVPVGALPALDQLRGAGALVAGAVAKLVESAIGLAAPVVVALWLTDVTLGIVGRAAPQIPVYFTGMPVKALLGLAIVLAGLGALQAAVTAGAAGWAALVQRAFDLWRPR